MRRTARYLGLILAGALAGGCTSLPVAYIPQTVGPLEESQITNFLEVRIEPDKEEAVIGDLIRFRVILRNTGTVAFYVPRKPDLLFTWTYADGVRDNYVCELPFERFYFAEEAVLLKPGEQITTHMDIKTYYFDTPGITEFRAYVCPGRNTNPELTPFWQGKASSNGYGVVVKEAKKKPYSRYGGGSPSRRPTS